MEGMETPPTKISFKEQMHQARRRAILQAACDLLGAKSFDAMTMDDVANGVGIAKASLYTSISAARRTVLRRDGRGAAPGALLPGHA